MNISNIALIEKLRQHFTFKATAILILTTSTLLSTFSAQPASDESLRDKCLGQAESFLGMSWVGTICGFKLIGIDDDTSWLSLLPDHCKAKISDHDVEVLMSDTRNVVQASMERSGRDSICKEVMKSGLFEIDPSASKPSTSSRSESGTLSQDYNNEPTPDTLSRFITDSQGKRLQLFRHNGSLDDSMGYIIRDRGLFTCEIDATRWSCNKDPSFILDKISNSNYLYCIYGSGIMHGGPAAAGFCISRQKNILNLENIEKGRLTFELPITFDKGDIFTFTHGFNPQLSESLTWISSLTPDTGLLATTPGTSLTGLIEIQLPKEALSSTSTENKKSHVKPECMQLKKQWDQVNARDGGSDSIVGLQAKAQLEVAAAMYGCGNLRQP